MPGMAETAVSVPARSRTWVPPLAIAGAAVASCLYLAWQDPTRPGAVLPECPTKLLTGLDCPLCGGLRCVRSVTTGDWGAAAHDNVVLLLALPVLVVLAVAWTVVRNLPAWPLHPLA